HSRETILDISLSILPSKQPISSRSRTNNGRYTHSIPRDAFHSITSATWRPPRCGYDCHMEKHPRGRWTRPSCRSPCHKGSHFKTANLPSLAAAQNIRASHGQ
ncbi:unnamed protein product, partial [Scytosiphon promiscuus]